MRYAVVLAKSRRALVIGTPDPYRLPHIVLAVYNTRTEAERRCEIENDPDQRALFLAGKLELPPSNPRHSDNTNSAHNYREPKT